MPLPLGVPGQPDVTKMRWQVDYGKLASESKELSQGFLKEWIKTENELLGRSTKQRGILAHPSN
jgi:hypothetical protein